MSSRYIKGKNSGSHGLVDIELSEHIISINPALKKVRWTG
jgi:hypothetical protein